MAPQKDSSNHSYATFRRVLEQLENKIETQTPKAQAHVGADTRFGLAISALRREYLLELAAARKVVKRAAKAAAAVGGKVSDAHVDAFEKSTVETFIALMRLRDFGTALRRLEKAAAAGPTVAQDLERRTADVLDDQERLRILEGYGKRLTEAVAVQDSAAERSPPKLPAKAAAKKTSPP
jgi:hypothetical protein